MLGFAPLEIGIAKLWKLWRPNSMERTPSGHAPSARHGKIAAVAAVTIANGGDNLGVYMPLFASQTRWELSVTIAVFAVLTLLWCAMGWALVNNPMLGRPIRRYGHIALPFVLIGLGGIILYRSGAIDLLTHLG